MHAYFVYLQNQYLVFLNKCFVSFLIFLKKTHNHPFSGDGSVGDTTLDYQLNGNYKVIKKIIPDAPHATLLTLDATTGQNALEQIKIFKQSADISGLIITKLDGSSKGGIIVAMAQENALPVYYIGVGEKIDDLQPFKAHDFAESLLEIKE